MAVMCAGAHAVLHMNATSVQRNGLALIRWDNGVSAASLVVLEPALDQENAFLAKIARPRVNQKATYATSMIVQRAVAFAHMYYDLSAVLMESPTTTIVISKLPAVSLVEQLLWSVRESAKRAVAFAHMYYDLS